MNREYTAEQAKFINEVYPDLMKIVEMFFQKGLQMKMEWHRLPPPPRPPADVIPIKQRKLRVVK